ncbi:Nif3-like dinuclear metal center hexameric protein [Mesoplasma melaleucae]|uniref:GTP cyclohydrolase 1 type 2 homolog n=1 Tax=Mesoplasma melaleucae TaxID=81459 RepID=A0A2K8NXN5_9MOLU|nr:Nif3-like dinuclear metal center hexameric protein [Mesoplasma melaleucae]ATZ17948.1 Nif3-like dinuclear metal center hexameric protein [Mesoplasma melaleucae]
MKLNKIVKYLEKKFPTNKAYDWDSVGFQQFNKKVIDFDKEISNVLITMDLTKLALDEIKKNNIELIITRHPFIFNELTKELENPFKKDLIKFLTKENILVYSIHTNYDICAYQSFIDQLNTALNIKKAKFPLMHKEYLDVTLAKELSINDLINKLKVMFNTKTIEINSELINQNKISNFLINQGSGASAMFSKQLSNIVFITGEAKWSDWIYANDNNVTLIVVGHYMENYFINDLASSLSNNFKDLKIEKVDIKEQYYVK